ncbi:MAG TPA: hypothetical protein VKY85_07685 [Candidatus Angelobacter sp.]|nr:hypothetical protein [Candidatus Angelobacter sp.]
MPPAGAILAAAALAGALYAGEKTYTHVLKPAGCVVMKVATIGKKHCARKPAAAVTTHK